MSKKYKNPSEIGWGNLTLEQQKKEYKALVKVTNQRLRELEKQGLAQESSVYSSLEKRNIRTKTGNVGFSTEGLEDWGKSTLKKEYLKVYSAYTAPSSSSSKQVVRERREKQLAIVGIDYDEMIANPKKYKKQLDDFWALFNEGYRVGLWDKFGLGSYEVEEVLREYMTSNRLPKAGSGTKNVVGKAMRRVEEIEAEAALQPDRLLDAVKQEKLLFNDTDKRFKSLYDGLLKTLAKHVYGMTPFEVKFGSLEKDYYL